jgi:hypothetical protein
LDNKQVKGHDPPMNRFLVLGMASIFVCACGDGSPSDIGQKGTGGASAGGSAGSASGGVSGSTSGGSAGSSSGGVAGSSPGGSAGTSSGGSAGASVGGSAGVLPENCQPHTAQESECAGKPPNLIGCFNGAPYEMPRGCVNIYIGNATDYWCCP